MGKGRMTSTPYDDVFRTLLNDCSPLILPLLNEIFGEHYSGQETVIFSPNEHFLNRQGGKEEERITDTSFEVRGRETKKYHLECQSSADRSMLVRLFEYGTQIALDEGEIQGDTLTVALPHAAVLFLRHQASTPQQLRIRIETPGGSVEYGIPVVKIQQYSLEDVFGKELLLLLPFYIFSHETRFEEYERDPGKLGELREEYEWIKARLERLSGEGKISEYTRCTIIDMSNKVLEHIANRYHAVREGVKSVMGGKVLEYEAKTIKREGIKEGIEGTVSILKALGIPPQTILVQIQEQYHLSVEAAKKYL